MAKFLTTSAISYEIENTLRTARKKLVLISPYLQLSETLMERLQDADRRDVEILIVYGKSDLKTEEESKLSQLSNIRLFFHKNLHAKCYFNEERAIVGSMNMYEFSEKNNREMGVLLCRYDDRDAFDEVVEEAESIQNAAEAKGVPGGRPDYNSSKTTSWEDDDSSGEGFCIRCGGNCCPDPNRPLCPECFSVWVLWEEDSYIEKYCHNCGKPEDTSKARPLCHRCFFGNRGL